MRVIKRSNDIVDFDRGKITNAIVNCMQDIGNVNITIAEAITDEVVSHFELELKHDTIHIEDIQDCIEKTLMKKGLNDVAKNFILYRDKRKELRYIQANMYEESQKMISRVLGLNGIENSNANVDEGSYSGMNNKIQAHIVKDYALNNLIRKDIAEAFRVGRIYLHDLDNWASGMHNCLTIDFHDLFENNRGFYTRNGDVRKPNDIMTFFQLVAVVFQCESQVQFGGVGSNKIDYDAAPYVAITFRKSYKDALMDVRRYSEDKAEDILKTLGDIVRIGNDELIAYDEDVYETAYRHTYRKTMQGAESLYHNLNTLESRAGSQVPFTSINFGTDISHEGRMVSECLLKASIAGIGEHRRTSIFPISIFKHKKGVNDVPGTPNYDLKLLALKSLSKRIYPNIANVDAPHLPKPTCPDEEFSTMGCRTAIGRDRHGLGDAKGGRGNIAPTTINLVDLGIRYGICKGEREVADIEGFWKGLDEVLCLAEDSLVERFEWIASHPARCGFFLYENNLMKSTLGRKLLPDEEVREAMKHNTLAIGYAGIAETMYAMFGKTHTHDDEVFDFAYKIVERIYNFANEASDRNDLNFSCYATPLEGACATLRDTLVKQHGVIEGVTDRAYISNSHHIPVYDEISIYDKIDKEAKFAKFATGGYICYVELESSVVNNLEALERIINYAMDKGVTYLAINFPIDTCTSCGYSAEMKEEDCPVCHSENIERLRRVTGYLTADYRRFNRGKIAETLDRVKHSKFTNFSNRD